MDPMSGFDIRLVFTLPPRDSTLQLKDAYTSEITFLALHPRYKGFMVTDGFVDLAYPMPILKLRITRNLDEIKHKKILNSLT